MSSPRCEGFRFPVPALHLHRVLGGRRHSDAELVRKSGDRVRIKIVTPKGATLYLPFDGNVERASTNADAAASLGEVVAQKIATALGPEVSRMGLVAFAFAYVHAAEEGREPDGRFWYSPTAVADVLGYERESNSGKGDRIRKDVIRRIDRDFAFYCKTELRQTANIDGTKHKDSGVLIDCLERYSETIPKARRGRRKRQQYQIRPELWALLRDYVHISIELLHCRNVDPRRWAYCLRVYEELALHAWRNRERLIDGDDVSLSYGRLGEVANIATKATRDQRHADGDLRRYLDLLAARGAITYADHPLSDGQAGIRYRLGQDAIERFRKAQRKPKRFRKALPVGVP
jgi:hypothetical protein